MPALALFEPEILVEEYAGAKPAGAAIDQQESEALANNEMDDTYAVQSPKMETRVFATSLA